MLRWIFFFEKAQAAQRVVVIILEQSRSRRARYLAPPGSASECGRAGLLCQLACATHGGVVICGLVGPFIADDNQLVDLDRSELPVRVRPQLRRTTTVFDFVALIVTA